MQENLEPIPLDPQDLSIRFGRACDALCRALWADRYGIAENDGHLHTSDEARRVAKAVFDAIGIVPSDGGASQRQWEEDHAEAIRDYFERTRP